MTTLVDQNGVSCFIDENGVTEFVDQNGNVLTCGSGIGPSGFHGKSRVRITKEDEDDEAGDDGWGLPEHR